MSHKSVRHSLTYSGGLCSSPALPLAIRNQSG
jgi:hypothetical protein